MGLFAIASIKKGDIIGIYENYSGGKRLTSARIKRPSHRSAYAVEHNGLVRDAWNPDLNKPCCKLAYSNDSMDPNKDNATLGVNPNFPMSLLFIATQDIDADPANTLPLSIFPTGVSIGVTIYIPLNSKNRPSVVTPSIYTLLLKT